MCLKEPLPQPTAFITMFPYEYTDFLQLHINADSSFDYDFDAHIAQCANVFGHDEKGLSDDHHAPIPIILSASDGFGSSDSSSPSRSPSISKDNIKTESSDIEGTFPGPSSPPPPPPMRNRERNKSFDEPQNSAACPTPSVLSETRRSMIPLTTLPMSRLRCPEPELPPSQKRMRKTMTSRTHLYDEDADDESDNDTDDDYVPTRSSGPKRRRISSQLPIRRSAALSRSISISPPPIKRSSGSTLSRNRQAESATAIDRACNGGNLTFICPECGWKQANKRLPDFKRHLRTHTRPDETDQSKGWWCKGVPVEDAHKFNIPKDARSFVFLGQERIGGCLQTFSRRDALKRHLDNANVVCVGRPCEAADG
ncbi:hypothetical protein D9756_004811 [Leucocoprinus leucothites]|uniref:C2H2-type domain-containing protein n=1 Tax=Leucocoprinus leucothites TaxID=201217 RepID=A0A8H5G8Y6_9AGAR|nr:hypothetical protein D9756_004811 [Leucoagaricus leucothites]